MKTLIWPIFCLITINSLSQINTLSAKYQVTKNLELSNSTQKNLILSYKGTYLQKNNRSISYIEPEFLHLYPKGYIPIKRNTGEVIEFGICTDSIQQLSYVSHDSLLFRSQINFSGGKKSENQYFTYERDFYQWKILDETREIDGLICQRAQRFNIANGSLIWDGWFATEIPVSHGIENIMNVPGLLVEGISIGNKAEYKLTSYEINAPLDDSVFWPPQFNKPFIFRRHLSKDPLPK